MTEPIKVGNTGDIDEDEALVVPRSVTGTRDDIAVVFTGGKYFAVDNTCTHEQASLAEGWIEAGCIECPLHGATFRLDDGAVLNLPAETDIATHTIEVEGDALMLTPNPDTLA